MSNEIITTAAIAGLCTGVIKAIFIERQSINLEIVGPIMLEASGGFFTGALIGFCAEKLGLKDQDCQLPAEKMFGPVNLSVAAATIGTVLASGSLNTLMAVPPLLGFAFALTVAYFKGVFWCGKKAYDGLLSIPQLLLPVQEEDDSTETDNDLYDPEDASALKHDMINDDSGEFEGI